MNRTFGVVLAAATLTLAAALASPAAAGPAPAATPAPAPSPTPVCPPALPLSALVTGATATSVTITYSAFMIPPCGYDLPITVHLFGSRDDAVGWQDPVADGTSGPERFGTVTVGGLTPDTDYWFRISDATGIRDPYVIGGPARTGGQPPCTATATIDSAWGSGFVATVTVRNTSGGQLDGWRVQWRWSGDERIQSVWNAVVQTTAADVTAGHAGYNGSLAPGGSTTFGLLAATSSVPAALALTCAGSS
ncbi:cellulose binding domain-containing protein [Micromonospora radicis]|uniref:Endoglucanase n=1 Tax=Micromonospora radicis TaxID=1894971 RepID=A0A418MXF5_9ACTN|nr:cellulose binding domain-containing protein [Micromonospora radicis]RIV39718.1 endoglucanase [Micromonospora radicis]